MLLLDTNVVSAIRRPGRFPAVDAWFEAQPEDSLYLSSLVVGEIERGISKQQTLNPDFARDLRLWSDRLFHAFSDRIWGFEREDAVVWGQLMNRLGHSTPDVMLAAQAVSRGATIATRNVAHFEPTGARVINPFEPA
ncbi:type II toxin-antitoxin system VapC family toxin [Shimia ponticola]|uniref:type II toxin-antitoxin system VapC family toxin n=1 Tax=Shimia ponticola TaxID=2582893 RepID=UPI0011BD8F91|nr:type II toxin-antitoxin system VapC family toxin [Shimia ponticola]